MLFADHLVAHRGYPARLPENTLPSVEAALQAGARYVEVDVQLSKDAEPVLFHDRDLQRLCGQDGAVHDYNWHELQMFRVHDRSRAIENVLDIAIPHLHELVTLLRQHPDVTVFIELKRISLEQFGIQAVVEQVLPLLQPIKSQAVLISYSLDAMQYLRQTSDYPLGVVIDDWAQREQTAILALQPQYLFCKLASVPVAGDLVCKGSKLVLFECTDPQQAYSLLQRGASLVETFAIGEMLAAMATIGAPLE
ncbi:MAG: glycerophosphodiester phosphodiesterase family protein [Gammaproteobacteria bacterium]|nr:glycerophosphodiester phosphodiesterase family protein [Gammaproteobacteria bacterium]